MTQLGPYRLRTEIAVGGMAEVYLADHLAPADVRREVVVKRVLPQYADDPDHRNMFLDEARLMAGLTHPNIAQIYDVGAARGSVYLVMEYIRGPTVRDLLAGAADKGRRGLPRAVALTIAIAVAEALDYAHARRDPEGRPLGIVHRDLNPHNVLVAYTGAVKLIDFGIAKAAHRLHQTRSGIVKGTWGYIAPEQISRKAPLDHRADIFTLGVLLYELSFGRHPYGEGDHETEQLARMVNGSLIPPEQHDPHYPPALNRLLRACLRPDPADRPARMRDVVDALADHARATGESVTLGELAEVVDHFVPDPQTPRPTGSAPRALARAAALSPHEMTAPSISLSIGEEEETAPTRLKRLGIDPPAAPPAAPPPTPPATPARCPTPTAPTPRPHRRPPHPGPLAPPSNPAPHRPPRRRPRWIQPPRPPPAPPCHPAHLHAPPPPAAAPLRPRSHQSHHRPPRHPPRHLRAPLPPTAHHPARHPPPRRPPRPRPPLAPHRAHRHRPRPRRRPRRAPHHALRPRHHADL
ncbi:MAG: serine/threonine protein kinase [Myxococcales bacterium]|nr:serine/threonine protein kinase [Myxococcales bacterium]